MEETATTEPATEPIVQPPAESAPTPPDPFALDEAGLASLSPEQRASLDPIIEGWKKRAGEEITKRESAVAEKFKPYQEKAQALEKLTNYQPFVQWWQQQQQAAKQGATPGQTAAINQTKPTDVATPQEWQEALLDAAQGSSEKLQALQARAMNTWAAPMIQQMSQRQKMIETQIEVKDLFERHPDAKALDEIGLDPNTRDGVSLLEQGLDWAERNGKSLEQGYAMAKRWADGLRVNAQREAMGMVQNKKNETTAGNSTAKNNTSIVEVANTDEMIKKSLEAQLSGNKDVRFVIRGR